MGKLKMLKSIIFILMIVIFLFSFTNSVFAEDTPKITKHNWKTTIDDVDKDRPDTNLNTSVEKVIGAIISVLRIITTGVAIIMILVIAIKYMSAAPGDRADIKKSSMQFVVGAIVLFASSGILTIIQNFAKNIK